MTELGKMLVIVGLLTAAVGALLWSGLGRGWFGRLPGDILIKRDHSTFYFPLTTCIVISLIVTLISRLFRK